MSSSHARPLPFENPNSKPVAPKVSAINVDSITREIQELNYSDPSVATAIARAKLHTINRWNLKASQREEILAPFHQAFQKCVAYYRRSHNQSLFTSQPAERDLTELSLFSQEMASGYKHVFLDYLHSSDDDDLIAQALYFALYYTGQCMLQSYEQNLWQSPHLWQQLHCFYQIADDRGYLLLDIETEHPIAAPNTIESLYTQILLTALADPYQLDAGLHWLIYDCAGHWSHLTHLQPVQALRDLPSQGFMVRLDSDKPPMPLKAFDTLHQRSLRLLDTEKLSKQLTYALQQLDLTATTQQSTLSAALVTAEASEQPPTTTLFGNCTIPLSQEDLLPLMAHLQAHWCHKPVRSNSRDSKKEPAFLIWGLQDIFRVHDPVARRAANQEGKPIELQDRTTARIEDETDAGYCLTFSAHRRFDIRAGQLVCIVRRIDGKNRLELGVVRWSNVVKADLMRAGVQKLNAIVRSAKVGFEIDSLCDFQGLLLTYTNTTGNSHRLILPRGYFASGAYAYLQLSGKDTWHQALVTQQLNRNESFDYFDIDLTNHTSHAVPSSTSFLV